jgi:hypothetical protein
MQFNAARSPVGWAGFIKPNIGDDIDADVGQTMILFSQPAKVVPVVYCAAVAPNPTSR